MKKCPKCGGNVFIVTQHITQTVKVDGDGQFLEEVTSCDEITHRADDDDLWTCDKCGHEATGRDMK